MRPGILAIAVALLALPASEASAATVCVKMPPPAPTGCANNTNYDTLTQGFGAAAGLAGRDQIRIGAVTLHERALHSNPLNNPVDIVGSGQGADGTVMRSPTGQAALVLSEPSSTVSNMRFVVPAGPNTAGLDLSNGTAHDVTVVAEPGATNAVGIFLRDGAIAVRDATVLLETGSATGAISATGGGTYTIEDVVLTGQSLIIITGAPGTATARRVLTTAPCSYCVRVDNGSTLELTDALLLVPATDARAVWAQNGSITVRNMTMVGNGGTSPTGVLALGSPGGSASATVLDSIIWNVPIPLQRWEMGAPASVSADYSDFEIGRVSTTGPGAVTLGANNIEVDPLFANPAAGDFRLATGSPVVERGSPNPLATTLDLAGAARLTDADGDGAAALDLGAYEYQGAPFTPPALDTSGPRLGIRGKRLALDRRNRVRIGLTCPAAEPAPCIGNLALATAKRVRVGRRRRVLTLGRAVSKPIAPGRRATVVLRPTPKALRLIRRLKRLRVRVTVRATDTAGNTGTSSRRLPLRAVPKRRR